MRRRTAMLTACVMAAGVTGAMAQTQAPPGVVCADAQPQYGPGPAYGATPVPSYALGTGSIAGNRTPAQFTLSKKQLRINQRVSQAAIRRTNAIQAWLDAGVVGTDICGGALGPEEFSGIAYSTTGPDVVRAAPKPRSLNIAAPGAGDPSEITLSVQQLRINQRIAAGAVRRSNGLRARLVQGLTGGDVKDGTIGAGILRSGTMITGTNLIPQPDASVTVIATPTGTGNPNGFTLSRKQLRVNQRVSQAAVRRSNAIIAHIRAGLNGNDFRDGTLTPADLAAGAVSTP
ncbi:MAG: hypothetical protein KDC36_09295 [Thermoleophilia bacterium]|nr:hypothetical protein [Thermoleophilia bacterium]